MRRLFALLLLFATAASATQQQTRAETILIYSGTTGYRHDSIAAGIAALRALGEARGFRMEASEDPAVFTPDRLARFQAIIFLSSTTDPKNPSSEWLVGSRRAALQNYVRSGGGVLAVHAAADSHYHWPWYGMLIGGRFASHPEGTPRGKVKLRAPAHPLNRGLSASVERVDEWYYFDDFDPTSELLATLDPTSIGAKDVNPNPVAWTRDVEGGRLFYTAMGHTAESYSDPWFLKHLANGLDWVIASKARRSGR